jgi:superfamily I DNA and/or RNA helicase
MVRYFATQVPDLGIRRSSSIGQFIHWFDETYGFIQRRANLLLSWRRDLQKSSEQLHPELFHYADVVGATCIGVATERGLENLDFDLVIVDEAGQINLLNVLVPLVRARRAIMVGDHQQLPPFVGDEVRIWLRNLAPHLLESEDEMNNIAHILEKSAFELFFTHVSDPDHLVRFTQQGRMPQTIADFVGRHFYQGQLATFPEERMRHTRDQDPLFRRPLALIDIATAPESMRWNRRQERSEFSPDGTGYINQAEMQIVVEIARIYEETGRDWLIITPYRAQARLIIQELHKYLHTQRYSLEERVSTVDSFQGGEQAKIIYSFTRSNRRGEIGFLSELRRLNVAMTRAQQQLVLVGNFPMLVQSQNARFNGLLSDLVRYTQQHGEYWHFEDFKRHTANIRGREA